MQPVSFTALSKRSVCGLLVLVALVLVSNCRLSTLGVEGDDDRPSLAQVIVVAPDTILPVGERMQLSVMLLDEGGNEVTGLPLAWASADAAIATVDSSGLVRAKAEGSTRLIAASSSVTLPLSSSEMSVRLVAASASRRSRYSSINRSRSPRRA